MVFFYLLQVNYLHSHGLAHTELRLENVHVSPIDKHVKVSSLCFCKLLYSVLAIMLNSLLWTLMTC
jgi:serine/threonine protein kinase